MNFPGIDQILTPDVLQAILTSQVGNLNFWNGNGQFYGQNMQFGQQQFMPPTPYFMPPLPPLLPQVLTTNLPPPPPPQPEEPLKIPDPPTPKPQVPEFKKEPDEPSTSDPPEKSINFVMGQIPAETYYPTHFMRGTQLHVANGTVKRVEDLSSDDFLRCAAESDEVMVNASIIKSIQSTSPGSVQIVFETGIEKERIPLNCQIEHPFFVLGKGWSSCNPRKSSENYGLECAELQVNDVCVVLTRKEEPEEAVAVDIVTAERDMEKWSQAAAKRDGIAQVYYEYTSNGRLSAPPERICEIQPMRHRRISE